MVGVNCPLWSSWHLCDNRAMARTTAVMSDQGRPIYVGEGAVRQQGPLKLYECNTCGREVVWATSKRTGKVYLASVYRGEVVRYYVSKPHECSPRYEPPTPEVSPLDAAYNALTADFVAKRITRDQYIEACAEVDRYHGVC